MVRRARQVEGKMLKEFVEKKHYKFADSASDWREAIRMSCEVSRRKL